MNILILNSILYTPDGESNIPTVRTIKDTMIYGMCLGFLHLGHSVTLASVEDYRPVETEVYDFDVRFFKTNCKRIFKPSVLPYSSEMKKYLKSWLCILQNFIKYHLRFGIMLLSVFSCKRLKVSFHGRKKQIYL